MLQGIGGGGGTVPVMNLPLTHKMRSHQLKQSCDDAIKIRFLFIHFFLLTCFCFIGKISLACDLCPLQFKGMQKPDVTCCPTNQITFAKVKSGHRFLKYGFIQACLLFAMKRDFTYSQLAPIGFLSFQRANNSRRSDFFSSIN